MLNELGLRLKSTVSDLHAARYTTNSHSQNEGPILDSDNRIDRGVDA